jgi:pimeloyl-ACP methyl ester carboxylesterase
VGQAIQHRASPCAEGAPRSRSAWLASAVRVAAGAVLLVAGCRDDGSAPAAPATERAAEEPPPVVWTACEEDFECGTVSVPVDHDVPRGRSLPIALLKAPARRAAEGLRVGSLLINPGGPGAAMVERLAKTYLALTLAFPEVADRFDVIAFDWRGIGASAPLSCVDDAFFDAARAADLTLRSPGAAGQVGALTQGLVEGCQARADLELLTHVDTDSAARDLERVRLALGEDSLNFLGFSYGTWLGAKYATLYPGRVRAFVLDSAVASYPSFSDRLAHRTAALEHGLTRFFAACSADPACAFHGGADAATIATRLDDLLAKIAATPGGVPAGSRQLGATDASLAVSDGLRAGKWPPFAADLAEAEAGDATALLARADAVAGRRSDGSYDGGFLGLLTIGCLDVPLGPAAGPEPLAGLAASGGPRAGDALVAYSLCAGWPWKTPQPPVLVSAPSAPPLLVISTRHDPITPYEEGAALVDALGNGSHLLTYEGDGHSAAFHSACVRAELTRFLVDPSSPPTRQSCPPE